MSEYVLPARKRARTLMIVEGNHEKNVLFEALFKCFPELGVRPEDIWIYGTNIYVLFHELEKEYGQDWDSQDVDLPFLIAKIKKMQTKPQKNDFTNIIIVFDYERHDPFFDAGKITRMQEYFSDVTDVGQLYLNYPMVESYCHFNSLPDTGFLNLKVASSMKRGTVYKDLVRKTLVTSNMTFPEILEKNLREVVGISDETQRKQCLNDLLNCSNRTQLDNCICKTITFAPDPKHANTGKHALPPVMTRCNYTESGMTYWEYIRRMFVSIIHENIRKSNYITEKNYMIAQQEYPAAYAQVSLQSVLAKQNAESKDIQKGHIWVLNTSVFMIADYNSSLILLDPNPDNES